VGLGRLDTAGAHQQPRGVAPCPAAEAGRDDDGRADRLATHPALGGPDLAFLQAHLARLRGDLDQARKLVEAALAEQPGNTHFQAFATEIGSGSSTWFDSRLGGRRSPPVVPEVRA
jgi:hypothetical protein